MRTINTMSSPLSLLPPHSAVNQPPRITFTKGSMPLFIATLSFLQGVYGIYMLLHFVVFLQETKKTTMLAITASAPLVTSIIGLSFYGYLMWLEGKKLKNHPSGLVVTQIMVFALQVVCTVIAELAMVVEPLVEVVGSNHQTLTTFFAVWGGAIAFLLSSMIICLAMNQVVIVDHLFLSTVTQLGLIVTVIVFNTFNNVTIIAVVLSSIAFIWKLYRFYRQWLHYEGSVMFGQTNLEIVKNASFLVIFISMMAMIITTFLLLEEQSHAALIRVTVVFIVIFVSLVALIISKTITSRLKPVLRLTRHRVLVFFETNTWSLIWILFWVLNETKTNHIHHLIWWAPIFVECVIFLRKIVRKIIANSIDEPITDQSDNGCVAHYYDCLRNMFDRLRRQFNNHEEDLSLPFVTDRSRLQSFPKGSSIIHHIPT